MLLCHSCYIYGTCSNKEVGGFKVIAWRKAERGQATKGMGRGGVRGRGDFTPQLGHLNYLPISASFGVKRIL